MFLAGGVRAGRAKDGAAGKAGVQACPLFLRSNKSSILVIENECTYIHVPMRGGGRKDTRAGNWNVAFEAARTVFDDWNALLLSDPDHSEEEERFLLLGMSTFLHLLVVCHCYREDDAPIRRLAARPATKKALCGQRRGDGKIFPRAACNEERNGNLHTEI